MDGIAIVAVVMFAIVYLHITSSVKVGQVWESCSTGPFVETYCEYRKITEVQGNWVQYKVWHTGWPITLSQKGQSRIYKFIFMKLKEDV